MFATSQITITPGVQRGYNLGFGIQPLVFVPDDYNNTPANFKYRVVVFLSGIGETDSSSLKGHGFPKRVGSLGFNGKQPLPNSSDTAKYIVLSIHYDKYVSSGNMEFILNWFINNFTKTDTSQHHLWTITGLSMGTYSVYYSVNASQNFDFHNIFTKCINASSTDQGGITSLLQASTKNYWLFHGKADVLDARWNWQKSQDIYDALDNAHYRKLSLLDGYGHTDQVWDSMTSTVGNSYLNNVWIWMAVVDTLGTGSGGPPPPAGPFAVGSLRQKTVSGDNFLYYIPDTAQRATLKYYFIYNIIDTAAVDSAWAVQKGLAKKYKDGWNGKQPLCNGDTAVFSMVMQLDDPIVNKNALELGIQWALDSLPTHVFDTTASTNRMKNIFTGISHGATGELLYLMTKFDDLGQGGALKFWKNFGVYVSVDHRDNGYVGDSEGWSHVDPPFKSWWWSSSSSAWPHQVVNSRTGEDNADNENPFPDTKITEIAVSYSPVTWDSAYSTQGATAANNVFRWIADSEECEEMLLVRKNTPAVSEQPPYLVEPSFKLIPNPASDRLIVSWNAAATKRAEVSIVDMQGKILYKRSINSTKGNNLNQVPVYSLVPGQYMIRLTTEKEIFMRKFIKQ